MNNTYFLFFFLTSTWIIASTSSSSSSLSKVNTDSPISLPCAQQTISSSNPDTLCDIHELKKGKRLNTNIIPGICCEAYQDPQITFNTILFNQYKQQQNKSINPYDWILPYGCRICPSEPLVDNHYVSRSFYVNTDILTSNNNNNNDDEINKLTINSNHKVKLFGHIASLGNPINHFSILVPSSSCPLDTSLNTEKELPIGLYYPQDIIKQEAHWSTKFQLSRGKYTIQITSSVHGCRIATNGGLFNTKTGSCYGNIISKNKVRNISGRKNAQLGYFSTYNPSSNPSMKINQDTIRYFLMTGYFTNKEIEAFADEYWVQEQYDTTNITDSTLPIRPITISPSKSTTPQEDDDTKLNTQQADENLVFTEVIGGASWLVRNHKNYAAYSALHLEDSSIQETSTDMSNFVNTLSGRTAIGINKQGHLVLAQLDGRSWWNGIDLVTFGDWLIGQGIISAINLDGGGSSMWLVNNELVNSPTYSCSEALSSGTNKPSASPSSKPYIRGRNVNENTNNLDYEAINKDNDAERNYHCPRKISSLVCIHAVPPIPQIIPTISFSNDAYDEGTMINWEEWKIKLTNGCVCQEKNTNKNQYSNILSLEFLYSMVEFVNDDDDMSTTTRSSINRKLQEKVNHNEICLCTPSSIENTNNNKQVKEHYTISIIDSILTTSKISSSHTSSPDPIVSPSSSAQSDRKSSRSPTRTPSISSVPYVDDDNNEASASPSSISNRRLPSKSTSPTPSIAWMDDDVEEPSVPASRSKPSQSAERSFISSPSKSATPIGSDRGAADDDYNREQSLGSPSSVPKSVPSSTIKSPKPASSSSTAKPAITTSPINNVDDDDTIPSGPSATSANINIRNSASSSGVPSSTSNNKKTNVSPSSMNTKATTKRTPSRSSLPKPGDDDDTFESDILNKMKPENNDLLLM